MKERAQRKEPYRGLVGTNAVSTKKEYFCDGEVFFLLAKF